MNPEDLSPEMLKVLAQTLVQYEKSAGAPYWDRQKVQVRKPETTHVWSVNGSSNTSNASKTVRIDGVIVDEIHSFNVNPPSYNFMNPEWEKRHKTPDPAPVVEGNFVLHENPSHQMTLRPKYVLWATCGHRFLMKDGIHPMDHEHYCPRCWPDLRTCNVDFENEWF